MRIVLAGTSSFADTIFQFIYQHFKESVIAVYTQPDKPSGRGKKINHSPVKQWAMTTTLPIVQPISLKQPICQEQLKTFTPDLLLVIAYGQILPTEVLQIPTKGCLNIHASLLPKWRGAAPIQRSIENGDTTTGNSIILMNEKVDEGDVLLQDLVSINEDNSLTLQHKLAQAACPSIYKVLQDIDHYLARAEPQIESLATYAPKISKQESEIDWYQSAETIQLKINALFPTSTAFSLLNDVRIKCSETTSIEPTPLQFIDKKNGTIVHHNNGIGVKTASGVLTLTKLQLAGKKNLDTKAILHGYANLFCIGNCFGAE